MRTKTFKFQLEVEDVPYAPDTVEALFGQGATYNPDFPEHVMASETIDELLKDAVCHVLIMKMNFLCQHKVEDTAKLTGNNKYFWEHLCRKEERYRQIAASLKSV